MIPNGDIASYSILLDEEIYTVQSAGDVDLKAGNSSSFNDNGGSIGLVAGSGVSEIGGSGGDVFLKAGDGYGQERFGGEIGTGGDIVIVAGSSVEGSGGRITIRSGSSFNGESGPIEIFSAVSNTNKTGEIIIRL